MTWINENLHRNQLLIDFHWQCDRLSWLNFWPKKFFSLITSTIKESFYIVVFLYQSLPNSISMSSHSSWDCTIVISLWKDPSETLQWRRLCGSAVWRMLAVFQWVWRTYLDGHSSRWQWSPGAFLPVPGWRARCTACCCSRPGRTASWSCQCPGACSATASGKQDKQWRSTPSCRQLRRRTRWHARMWWHDLSRRCQSGMLPAGNLDFHCITSCSDVKSPGRASSQAVTRERHCSCSMSFHITIITQLHSVWQHNFQWH